MARYPAGTRSSVPRMPIEATSGSPPYTSCCAPSVVRKTLGRFASAVEFSTIPTMRRRARSDFDVVANTASERARHRDLAGGRRRAALRHGGHAGSALRGAENVDVARRITEGGGTAGVRERSRRDHARGRGDPSQVHRRERCGSDKRAGCACLDEEQVHAKRVDGLLGLDPEPVRKPGEYEGHREDDGGGEDRDDETPFSPLHVAQRGHQHGRERYRRTPIRGPGLASWPRTRGAGNYDVSFENAPTSVLQNGGGHRACG